MIDLRHVLHPTLSQRAPEHQRRKRANLDVERLLAQTGSRDPLQANIEEVA